MHQVDFSILERSNVQSNVIVVNQCDCDKVDRFSFINKFGEKKECIFIYTTERGLSRSRNMAISFAPNDAVCLICDDDEILDDDVEFNILSSYTKMPDCSVALFSLIRRDGTRTYPQSSYRIRFRDALRVNSLQISFRNAIIKKKNIRFDIKMGSGSGNGGGEENKFLLDCLNVKLHIHYFPINIAIVLPGKSQWFDGFNKNFFSNQGWVAKYMLGYFLGIAYIFYSTYHLRYRYKNNASAIRVFWWMIKGYLSVR